MNGIAVSRVKPVSSDATATRLADRPRARPGCACSPSRAVSGLCDGLAVRWMRRRSVVPTIFWWMSLLGASMLLVYFIWRKDIGGILGQGTGWAIYARNLWMIYRPRPVVGPELEDRTGRG